MKGVSQFWGCKYHSTDSPMNLFRLSLDKYRAFFFHSRTMHILSDIFLMRKLDTSLPSLFIILLIVDIPTKKSCLKLDPCLNGRGEEYHVLGFFVEGRFYGVVCRSRTNTRDFKKCIRLSLSKIICKWHELWVIRLISNLQKLQSRNCKSWHSTYPDAANPAIHRCKNSRKIGASDMNHAERAGKTRKVVAICRQKYCPRYKGQFITMVCTQ